MSSEDDLIFISIAAYRDPQLGPTIKDCLGKALHPERLRFGICWQRGEEEAELSFDRADPRFRVLAIDWRESRGACWARAEIMKLWQGEDWFLQVDSHCRFIYGWDTKLIDAMARTGSPKPLLSTYALHFKPARYDILVGSAMQIAFQAFTPDGIPQLKPAPFTGDKMPDRPVPARFLAAGFLFAPGSFVQEVPYDPDLYFMGEETAMTVRAYTHGYDLFHPVESIVWHDYLRLEARKHWGDHTTTNVARPWSELDQRSRGKVQQLLRGESVESFGLGSVRTLEQYEAYAGLSFRLRKAHPYTVLGEPPPNPEPPPDWAEKIQPWITKIVFERDLLPEGALEDPALWCIGIEDSEGREICRIDAVAADLVPFRYNEEKIALTCEFPSDSIPAAWTMQPLSLSQGWLKRIGGRLEDGDYAIVAEEDDEELDAKREQNER